MRTVVPETSVRVVKSRATEWDTFVRSHPERTLYHLWAWGPLLAEAYRQQHVALSAERADEVVGVLPLLHVRSRLFGDSLVSLPYHAEGGILARDDAAAAALADGARHEAVSRRVRRLILRGGPRPVDVPSDDSKGAYFLDLTPGPDAVFASFRKQNRTRIRKGRRLGVEVRFGHELLPSFYQLYLESMRRHGSPAPSPSVFEGTLRRFGGDAQISMAFRNGVPVATKLHVDAFGVRTLIWGANSRAHADAAPNYPLMWSVLEDAMARGLHTVALGRSTRGTPHARTKLEWGAREVPLPYHHVVGTPSDAVSTSGSRFDRAIRAWRAMPLWATRLIGPPIARQIP